MSLTVPVSEIVSESHNPLLGIHSLWKRVELSTIAKILNGFAFESKYFNRATGVPLLRIRDIGNNTTGCFYGGPFDAEYLVRAGDLVVGMDGDFKCALWQGTDALLNQRVCKVELLTANYNPVFLELVLPAYLDAINENTSSQTVRHLSSRSVAEIPVPLPPLSEQERIVVKIEALLAQVNAARERLARVPKILKRFRQAILAAACSGRLTEDWRKSNPQGDGVKKLLADVLSRRKHRTKESGLGRYHEPCQPDTTFLSEVPEEWELASMDQLTCLVTSGSRGWAKYYVDSGPYFIRAENINTDSLRLRGVAHVDPPNNAEGRRTRIERGDLLVTITGANVTKSALVEIDLPEAYVSQHIALVRPIDPSLGQFLYLWAVSPNQGRAKLINDAYGAGKPGLNLDNIKEMPVGLPSIDERREIVRRVGALFNLADMIEKRVEAAMTRADKLTQAILAKAFRGELVPTEAELARREDRTYEPASVLLERIKVERERATQKSDDKRPRHKATAGRR
ncbi:MAG TPA: restriction endonuclease subunit S [Acidobacteriota bacterium]|jgi:type I restriction enzyme S subunit